MRKFVLPTVVGFALFCLVVPVGHWLLTGAHVGSATYDVITWSIVVGGVALPASLVVVASGLGGRAAATVIVVATLVSAVLILCSLLAIAALAWSPHGRWLFGEPAMVVGLMLFAVLTVSVSHGFVWLARRTVRERVGSDAQ